VAIHYLLIVKKYFYGYNYNNNCVFILSGRKKKKQRDIEDPSIDEKYDGESYPVGFLPQNYKTFHQFVKCTAYVLTLGLVGMSSTLPHINLWLLWYN